MAETAARAVFASAVLARIGAVAGCLVFAFTALISGLDRMAATHPGLAARLPDRFAAQSFAARGQAAIAHGDFAATRRLGELALRSAPLEPAHAALLGAGRLGVGDAAGAERAFRLAGQLGWRVPLTQAYWEQRALGVGDYRVATLRLDAILRQQPALLANRVLVDPIERDTVGRELLAARMRFAPDWLRLYTAPAVPPPPAVTALRAQVLEAAAQQGVIVGCAAIAQTVGQLAATGVAAANALWRAQCPGSGNGLIADPELAHASAQDSASPFAWELVGDADLSSEMVAQASGGRMIEVRSTAAVIRPFLRQLVAVEGGVFRLTWRARGDQSRIAVALGCGRDPQAWTPAFGGSGTASVSLTAETGCAGQWLVFGIRPGEGPVGVGAMTLARVR